MPKIKVKALVPGSLEQVYEHVTAFPPRGPVDEVALAARYGVLLERENNELTFWEELGDGVTWKCRFDPPTSRIMRAVDSSWSDRVDHFSPAGNGTLWTITWELKSRGLPSYGQWLFFHLRDRKLVQRRLVEPVVSHFQDTGAAG